jgi:hypothetical protein
MDVMLSAPLQKLPDNEEVTWRYSAKWPAATIVPRRADDPERLIAGSPDKVEAANGSHRQRLPPYAWQRCSDAAFVSRPTSL